MSHYLGNNTALCLNRYGQKMYVDTRDISIAPHLLEGGYWEQWITDAMTPFFRGATFFDVGANMGWYSAVAEKFGVKDVYSFEPNPRLASLLNKTMCVNGYQWHIECMALSDSKEAAILNVPPDLMGSATILPQEDWDQVSILCDRFDTYIENKPLQLGPYLFKIDVEGFEPRVVMGAEKFIRDNNCTLFVEKHSDPFNENRAVDMYQMLESAGYSIGHVLTNGSIRNIKYEEAEGVPDVDMLCFQRYSR
jgi:FkbM family methyltransferase